MKADNNHYRLQRASMTYFELWRRQWASPAWACITCASSAAARPAIWSVAKALRKKNVCNHKFRVRHTSRCQLVVHWRFLIVLRSFGAPGTPIHTTALTFEQSGVLWAYHHKFSIISLSMLLLCYSTTMWLLNYLKRFFNYLFIFPSNKKVTLRKAYWP